MNEANETLNRNNHQLVQFEILNQPAPPTQWGLFVSVTSHPPPIGGLSYGSKWGIPTQHTPTA